MLQLNDQLLYFHFLNAGVACFGELAIDGLQRFGDVLGQRVTVLCQKEQTIAGQLHDVDLHRIWSRHQKGKPGQEGFPLFILTPFG